VSPAVVIKKYPNRRLYDTSSGRYVNLEEVASMIRKGTDVRVVDARTGENLTRVVLTQIIVEDVKEKPAGLPLELLRQLVIATDRALSDVRSAALSPLQAVRSLLAPQPNVPQDELDELRRRVSELESQVAKQPARNRRASGRRKNQSEPGTTGGRRRPTR
jgi:polyhydroxyalkanoate synthesis repressor PhaR